MPISTSIPKFERFFRLAAGLDIDKEDLKRFDDFINRKIRDLVVRAEAFAKANARDIIMPYDLPITRGLRRTRRWPAAFSWAWRRARRHPQARWTRLAADLHRVQALLPLT